MQLWASCVHTSFSILRHTSIGRASRGSYLVPQHIEDQKLWLFHTRHTPYSILSYSWQHMGFTEAGTQSSTLSIHYSDSMSTQYIEIRRTGSYLLLTVVWKSHRVSPKASTQSIMPLSTYPLQYAELFCLVHQSTKELTHRVQCIEQILIYLSILQHIPNLYIRQSNTAMEESDLFFSVFTSHKVYNTPRQSPSLH